MQTQKLQQYGHKQSTPIEIDFKDQIDLQLQQNQFQRPNIQQSSQQLPLQNQQYTTSITQLISQPIRQSIYSVQYIFSSLYQLSQYLFTKKISQSSSSFIQQQNSFEISFDQYLKPLQQQLNKYDKFKKTKAKEQQFYNNNNTLIKQKNNAISSKSKQKQNRKIISLQSELIKCYQKVPYIYFQQNFTLDFSNFQNNQNKLKYKQKMKQSQQIMNDNLDLIEINLFAQIHKKFQDYFKAAANFDYLRQSIIIQLIKLKQSRSRISRVQTDFIIKSQKLRKKITQRTNYQKLIKKIQILKSLKKLPSLIQSILKSQFPFDCLSFLKQIKNSIIQVQQICSVKHILDNIKSCQTIVQLGLNKRYTDQLYLYVEQVFNLFNFVQKFYKISLENNNLLIKQDNSMNNISKNSLNNLSKKNSIIQNQSYRDKSGIFIYDDLIAQTKNNNFGCKNILKNIIAKRNQAKQYQISMILLQSYQYINFPVDVTKIKITNGLRVICKKFQKDLLNHFKKEIQTRKQNKQKQLVTDLSLQKQKQSQYFRKQAITQPMQNEQQQLQKAIQQVSIQLYTKNLFILNDLFKQTINRYLDYIMTLISQYEQKLMKMIMEIQSGSKKSIHTNSQRQISDNEQIFSNKQIDINKQLSESTVKILQKSQKLSKMQSSHTKFKLILSQQLGLLPSIFKILQQKLNHFLTLKNISNVTPQQFYHWTSLLRFWQKWFDTLTQQSQLLNYTCTYLTSQTQISSSSQLINLGQNMMEEIVDIVLQNIKKSLNTINIKNKITQLTINYLSSYCNSIQSQLHQGILQQSWQSIQIPQQFSDIINNIISRPVENNLQLTILNSSLNNGFKNINIKQQNQGQSLSNNSISNNINNDLPFKYKILKNNILIQGQRYKLTCSFLLLCEFIQQLIKIGNLFTSITSQYDQSIESISQSKHIKKILSCLYGHIYQLIELYNKQCKQMILQKKVLKMQKIKGNNITVKHICLLSNCLTFLQRITKQIPIRAYHNLFNKKQHQIQTIYNLTSHNILLIDKISIILTKKLQSLISIIKQQQKSSNISTLISQSNQSIVTVFLQITQIIDDCLDYDKCQKILKQPFQLFVQKYFKMIIMKGDKYYQELNLLLEKMKFLKKYFKNQFLNMQREIQL